MRSVRLVVGIAGLIFGAAFWAIHDVLAGDAFFHLGRIRKLYALHSLSLHDVGEFSHGGLHPGYAFPLWHGCMAVVARLAGVDPTSVVLHEPSLLVPLALVLAYEMGWAIFRSTGIAVAVVLAQVGLRVLAQGHGGIYPDLWQPGQGATQLFLPAVVTLFFLLVRRPSWPVAVTLAAGSADLALIHPTYALFIAIPLIAFVAVRVLLTRGRDLRSGIVALVALGLPMGLAYLWLRPVVEQSVALHLGAGGLSASLHHYRVDLVIHSATRYNLAPSRVDRLGSVPVAALALAPLAFFARRRRWSALVLGGTVVILALDLSPLVFPHFSNVVSLSQSRRAAVFIPLALLLAGGAAVIAGLSRLAGARTRARRRDLAAALLSGRLRAAGRAPSAGLGGLDRSLRLHRGHRARNRGRLAAPRPVPEAPSAAGGDRGARGASLRAPRRGARLLAVDAEPDERTVTR